MILKPPLNSLRRHCERQTSNIVEGNGAFDVSERKERENEKESTFTEIRMN